MSVDLRTIFACLASIFGGPAVAAAAAARSFIVGGSVFGV